MENSHVEQESSHGWRVKLYELESTGNWIDLGVGHVQVQNVTELGGPALCIASEAERGKYILVSKIQSEDLYEKQGETIILWKEYSQTRNIDYALSFQEATGCQDVWKTIIDVQGEYLQQREYGNVPSFGRTYRTNSITQADAEDAAPGPSLYRILPQDVSQPAALVHIKQKLESLHPSQRDYVFAQLLDEEGAYLRRLFALFEDLEAQLAAAEKTTSTDSAGTAARSQETVVKVFAQRADGADPAAAAADADDAAAEAQRSPTETETEGLFSATTTVHSAGATQQSADEEAAASDAGDRARAHSAPQLREWLRQLADILRQIVLLNDPTLIEYLLSDEVFACVAGVFEHDRALRSRGDYRDFLFRRARLVEVVALQSDVRSTAKFLFRLRFLKDTMLHPTIDEPGITALTSMIVFTSCEIAAKLLDDAAFCAALLQRVACDDAVADAAAAPDSTQALALLREALHLSTFLSPERRHEAVDAFLRRHGADFVAALTREFLRQLWPVADAPPAAEGDRGLQLAAEALLLVAQTQPSQLRRLLLSPAAGAQHPPPPALGVFAPSGVEAAAAAANDAPSGGWSLLLLLVDAVVNADDVVALELCAEALRLSLDFDRDALSALPAAHWSRGGAPAALSGEQRAEKERFLRLFYERHLPWLLAPFADAHDPAQPVPAAHYAPLLQATGPLDILGRQPDQEHAAPVERCDNRTDVGDQRRS
eukprot:gene9683-6929_t